MATAETVGERIKRLRLAKGLSVPKLARAVGVGENAIRKLEIGTSKKPSSVSIVRLAGVLGVSEAHILGVRHSSRNDPERRASVDTRDGPGDHAQSVTVVRPGESPPADPKPTGVRLAQLEEQGALLEKVPAALVAVGNAIDLLLSHLELPEAVREQVQEALGRARSDSA
jgi:transcriptional regulator with XRE-family HTH domain